MSSAEDALDRAEDKEIGDAVTQGISAIILTALGGFAALAAAFFDNLGDVFETFGAARDFIVALITDPIVIIEDSAGATAAWLVSANLGPLTLAAGVAAIAAAFIVWDALDAEIPVVGPLIKRITFWREDTDDETS